MDSILTSIKKQLNIMDEYTFFDSDILMDINASIAILARVGLPGALGFVVENEDTTWEQLVPNDKTLRSLVKQFIFLKTKLLFETSTMTSGVIESHNKLIEEIEWYISTIVDA